MATIVACLKDIGPFDAVRTSLFEAYSWDLKRPAQTDATVVVIDVDDASIANIGQWPWPRGRLAEMVSMARNAGAAAIAFDMAFPERDRLSPDGLARFIQNYDPRIAAAVRTLPDSDAAFAAALGQGGSVLGAVARDGPADGPTLGPSRFVIGGKMAGMSALKFNGAIANLPALARAADGVGVTNAPPGEDGVVRRAPLAFKVGRTLYPSLALEAVRVRLGAQAIIAEPSGEGRLGAITVGALRIPTDGQGCVWPQYAGTKFDVEPAFRLLTGKTDPALLKGKILFVGVSASGAATLANIGRGVRAPGHFLQAATASAILAKAAAYRPDYLGAIEAAAAAVATLAFIGFATFGRLWLAALVLIAAPAIGFWLSYTRYLDVGVLIDPTPVAATLATTALIWGAYLLFAQRLTLVAERSFVGRLVGQMSEGLIVTEPSGRVVTANPAAERMLGGAVPPFPPPKPARNAIGPDDDGNIVEIESARIEDRGHPYGVHVVRDITQLKAAEQTASLAMDRLASAASNMADGLILFDVEGRVLFHNPAILELAEAGEAGLAGQTYADVMAEIAPFGVSEADPSAFEFGARRGRLSSVGETSEEIEARSGRWLLIRERPTTDGGLVGVYTDITVLKETEADLREARSAAVDAVEAKNRFFAAVSHELRTPLNAILGFTESMRQEIFGPVGNARYRDYLDHIGSSGADLLDLVENLLDAAAAESGGVPIELRPINLSAAVSRVAATFRPQFEDAGVSFETNIAPGMPPCVADARAVRRMLSNLVANALKHGGRGAAVSARYIEGDGHVIEVSDRGDGMSPDDVERANAPYRWAPDPGAGLMASGLGLGLPLVKGLAELQGAEFRLASTFGEGAVARIRFPERATGPSA